VALRGIVRDVALVARSGPAIRRQEIRTRLEAASAAVTTRVFLDTFAAGGRLTVEAQVKDPAGRAVARAGQAVAGGGRRGGGDDRLAVPEPRLWHFDAPHLYRMALEVKDQAGAVLDRREESFGIRRVEVATAACG